MNVQTISPERLSELNATGKPIELIDVRTPAEFREIHIEFARNVPLDQLHLIGLSAFVGAGLIFAGVTDTCGMAMMLSRMPWNQVRN